MHSIWRLAAVSNPIISAGSRNIWVPPYLGSSGFVAWVGDVVVVGLDVVGDVGEVGVVPEVGAVGVVGWDGPQERTSMATVIRQLTTNHKSLFLKCDVLLFNILSHFVPVEPGLFPIITPPCT